MKKRDFFNWVNIRKWIFWILYIVWRKQKGQLPIIRRSFEHTHAIGRGGMGFTGVGFYLVVAKQSFFLSFLFAHAIQKVVRGSEHPRRGRGQVWEQ